MPFKNQASPAAPAPTEGLSSGAVAGGVAGIAGIAALAMRHPEMAGKIARGINAVRQQLMLSGFAGPKSLMGNVGAGVEAAVEGKGFGALKEILSPTTVREAVQNFRTGGGVGNLTSGQGSANLPKILSFPGRVMGAVDEATQAALRRAGQTAEEAQSATLQAPLTGRIGEVLESPVARYVHPFRRTPFNQFIEGYDKLKAAHEGSTAARRGVAAYGAAGAVHGAATADEDTPMSVPFAIAGSARYGLPYGLGALLGRNLAEGKTTASGIAGALMPVSEYGVEQAMSPTGFVKTFKPASITALERLGF